MSVPGHRGPHPEAYHQYIFGSLDDATRGLAPNTDLYENAVKQTLSRIKNEATLPGSQVNRWLTGE